MSWFAPREEGSIMWIPSFLFEFWEPGHRNRYHGGIRGGRWFVSEVREGRGRAGGGYSEILGTR